ncbi:MAG: 23S rRNA (guanosine(2251)-2'-O)-methyltransferase RlmB [Acidimicrobiales bacterium]
MSPKPGASRNGVAKGGAPRSGAPRNGALKNERRQGAPAPLSRSGKPPAKGGNPAAGRGRKPAVRGAVASGPNPAAHRGRSAGGRTGAARTTGSAFKAGDAPRGRPQVADDRTRSSRPTEDELGGEQVEGRRAVRELLAAGRRPVRDVWVSETLDEGPVVAEILELAEEAGVTIRRVPRSRIDAEARTDAAQGVLAHARPLVPVDLGVLCARRKGGQVPFLIVLDGVTDPQNVGAILRTAEIAGATGIILPKHRAAHITPTVAKSAAGAIEYLPFAIVAGIPAALAAMADQGVWTVGLDADGDRSVWDLELATEPLALVLGAEGAGLSRLAKARCDVLVSIPQVGRIPSLNVSAAAAVTCFEVSKRRQPAMEHN